MAGKTEPEEVSDSGLRLPIAARRGPLIRRTPCSMDQCAPCFDLVTNRDASGRTSKICDVSAGGRIDLSKRHHDWIRVPSSSSDPAGLDVIASRHQRSELCNLLPFELVELLRGVCWPAGDHLEGSRSEGGYCLGDQLALVLG